MKFNNLLFAFILFLSLNAFSQTELTLPFMENVHQSSYVNPSGIPDHKFSIGLPGISSVYVDLTNTGFSYSDLKSDTARKYDPYKALNAMKSTNYLNFGTKIDLFSMRFKARDWFFMMNVTENTNFKFSYPKDFFGLFMNGNGNQSVYDWKNLGIDGIHYREYGIGFTRDTKKFSFGGRFKLLQGLSNFHSETDDLQLVTDIDGMYRLKATADANFYSSGLSSFSNAQDYLMNMKNLGGAIDLGFTYKYTPKLHFVVSAINIGYINWTSDVTKLNFKGGAEFDGADVLKPFLSNGESFKFKEVMDSLGRKFATESSEGESYKTWLAPSFYVQANYHIRRKTSIGAAVYLEKYKVIRPTLTLMANQKVGRMLSVVGTYSIKFGEFTNVGVGLVFKPGPFDFYFVGDNLMVPLVKYMVDGFQLTEKNVDPLKTVNFRMGMNLVFGRIKQPDKLSYWDF